MSSMKEARHQVLTDVWNPAYVTFKQIINLTLSEYTALIPKFKGLEARVQTTRQDLLLKIYKADLVIIGRSERGISFWQSV